MLRGERAAGSVSNLGDIDQTLTLRDRVNDSIDVGLIAVEQMTQKRALRSDRASGGVVFQTEDGRFEASKPIIGC